MRRKPDNQFDSLSDAIKALRDNSPLNPGVVRRQLASLEAMVMTLYAALQAEQALRIDYEELLKKSTQGVRE